MGEANLADAEIFAFDEEWRLVGSHVQYCFNPMLDSRLSVDLLSGVPIVMMMASDVRWLQMMSLLVVLTGCYCLYSQTGREPQN